MQPSPMSLPRTRALGIRVDWHDATPSTNATLKSLLEAQPDLAHGTAVITDEQTAGRGRQGRGWVTPKGTALAVSVLLRDSLHPSLSPGWFPLIAGSAVAHALRPHTASIASLSPTGVGVKWPNDVHTIRHDGALGPKLCGVLCELTGQGHVIVGIGINLLIDQDEQPTPRAGSLRSIGADVGEARTFADPAGAELADSVLAGTIERLLYLARLAQDDPAEIRRLVVNDSATIGTRVQAHLPGGDVIEGRAIGLAEDGSLLIERPGHEIFLATAADIEHLREQPGSQQPLDHRPRAE